MSAAQFFSALERQFEDDRQLVFWNDPDGEFLTEVDAIDLPGVNVLRLDQVPALQAKVRLQNDPEARWLIYAPSACPAPEDDWLLDARLRGKAFSADSASMQLDELGLTSRVLHAHLKRRAKFMRSKDRVERLKRWVQPDDQAGDLDRKMLAVMVRAETPDTAGIFLKVFQALAAEGADLGLVPKPLLDMTSQEIDAVFWGLAEEEFGYKEAEGESPSMRGLLYRIFVSDFCNAIGMTPSSLNHFVIADRARAAHASVFASRWRSDMANYASYDALANVVAEELHVPALLGVLTAEQLVDAMTFESIDKRVIADLKARIISGAGANMDVVRELMARRRDGHWANTLLAGANDHTKALAASYDALGAAASFFELQAKHSHGFSFGSADAAFEAYKSELFRFDQLYRSFMRATDAVEPMGWSLLHELRDRMEDAYSGWFIGQLSSAWDAVVGGDAGLLKHWKLNDIPNQQNFFEQFVAPSYSTGAKRVYVVISDAFRFEAAEELVSTLNSKNRVKARLETMLGVLPSYTTLGMASLLPHKQLAYRNNAALDVTVDGMPTATLEQRSAVLAQHGGVAISRDELMEMGKTAGREFVKPYELIYVYHDHIDAIGDKRGTEGKTFEATEQAIRELQEVVSFIMNNLNGSTIFVTADHGFLYQESALEDADRSVVEEGKAEVYQEANAFCAAKGLDVETLNLVVTPAALARLGSTELRFKCVPKGSDSAKPHVRESDQILEIRNR